MHSLPNLPPLFDSPLPLLLQIWAQTEEGFWRCLSSWVAHSGAVSRVSWAHPEFGQVLATCSTDKNVKIWEEQEGVDEKGFIVSRWNQRAQLGDARDALNDVEFAPRHMGLKFASASEDGMVRIYEATDVMSLTHWEFTVRGDGRQEGVLQSAVPTFLGLPCVDMPILSLLLTFLPLFFSCLSAGRV